MAATTLRSDMVSPLLCVSRPALGVRRGSDGSPLCVRRGGVRRFFDFGGGIEAAECGVACDGASMVEYLGDAVGGNSDVSGEFGGAHAKFVSSSARCSPGWIAGMVVGGSPSDSRISTLIGPGYPRGHSKQILHWSLTRMLYWPFRSPFRVWKRLPGSVFERRGRLEAIHLQPR